MGNKPIARLAVLNINLNFETIFDKINVRIDVTRKFYH